MKTIALFLFAVCSANAQVTASFSLQPLETWKAVIGKRLAHTAVYDATTCNAGTQSAVVPAGQIFQAARTKIATVSPLLINGTISRAQSKTAAYRALEIATFAAWGISVAAASSALKMPDNTKIALPLLGEALSHIAGSLQSKVPSVDKSAFLDGALALSPGTCESRLILGEYRKDVDTFSVVLGQVPTR